MPLKRALIGAIVAAGLLLPLAGGLGAEPVEAAGAQPAPARTYVGALPGGEAYIAVVLDGRQVLAYVCDGTPAGLATWGWFVGERAGSRLDLVATNGSVLLLDLSGETPAGTLLTRDGARLDFATELARPPAGLWRAQGLVASEPVLAAWVVLNDGKQRGAHVRAGTPTTVGFIDPTANEFIDPTTNFSRPRTVNVGGGALEARLVGFIDPTSDLGR